MFDIEGTGQPIVFVHAALGDRRMWAAQWQRFSATNRCVRMDLAGFGEHALASEPFSRAAHVAQLLDDHGITDAVVVGGSMGGRVSLELAVDRPDLVSGLVLVCGALPGHEWSTQVRSTWAAEEAAIAAGDLDRAVDINLGFWLDGPDRDSARVTTAERALVAAMVRRSMEHEINAPDAPDERMLVESLADRLNEIAVPTRIAWGTADVDDLEVIARRIASGVSDATLHPIEDSAHLPSMEAPGEINDLIADLAAALPGK